MVDAFRMTDSDELCITLGPKLKDELSYPDRQLPLKLRWNTPFPQDGKVVQLDIVPRDGYFEVHAMILLPEPVWRTEGQTKAIDLGMRNPVVMSDESGNTEIFKGGKILSTLHYWNKEKARVQGEVMERSEGKKDWSKPLSRMSKTGARQVKQAVHALTSTVTEMCVKDGTREVVVGDLYRIKKEKDGTGKRWTDKPSQNWQQFPVRTLVAQLRYKLARHGIQLIEQDERGTSKGRCSLCGCTDRSKLHRVHRGLFHCENCYSYQNADENGARNQIARYLHREGGLLSEGSSGSLADPRVWRWDDHRWLVVVR
jgi:putative transposase